MKQASSPTPAPAGESINEFLGRYVVVAVPGPMHVADDVTADSPLPRTREIDLRLWFFDAPAFVYRRRDPYVPTQTDLAVSGSAVAGLPLADAARLLELIGQHRDLRLSKYYAARRRSMPAMWMDDGPVEVVASMMEGIPDSAAERRNVERSERAELARLKKKYEAE